MKLAVSNIAWEDNMNESVYKWMQDMGYTGLEIAPTRLFPDSPYSHLHEAGNWMYRMWEQYHFSIPSMQSIWYGRKECIFGSEAERQSLLHYTYEAIAFAECIGCKNIVFGCPRNRNNDKGLPTEIAVDFFRSIAEAAVQHHTCIGLEPNPEIYGTNFITTTAAAIEFIRMVDHPGLRLNLDFGTMIANNEVPVLPEDTLHLVNHVHISEPYLALIRRRKEHRALASLLRDFGYRHFVSIEMGRRESFQEIEDTLRYISSIFYE